MRDCPKCNRPITQTPTPGGGVAMYCPACGWGRERAEAALRGDDDAPQAAGSPRGVGRAVLLLCGWVFSLAIVVGPYAGAWMALGELPPWVHLSYWMLMSVYLMAAATMTPTFDESNLGIAGTMIDNPFSLEDDMNRFGLGMTVALLPGKLVCSTIRGTWRFVVGK